MKFKTHNEKTIDTCGSSFVGNVKTKYRILEEKFGKPTPSDGYKSDAEWEIEFENGVVATIYNWKDGKNYNSETGLDVADITDWHIGGFTNEVVQLVKDVLN